MTVVFGIKGEFESSFTTDPSVVPGSRHIMKGDYVRLPNDRVYKLVSDHPTEFVLVDELEIPSLVVVLEAKAYDAVNGKVIE